MTRDEAIAAWREIHTELSARCVAVRPKLKSYEARLLLEKARHAVVSEYLSGNDEKAARAAAIEPFQGLKYVKGSTYA